MCQAIFSRKEHKEKQGNPSHEWKVLPCLCCQAAGGEFSWANDISIAWYLFHNAARLMDNVEDNEIGENNLSIDLSLNAASGLFFTAQYAVYKISQNPFTRHAADEINHNFISKLLSMCEGQHQDITLESPNLEQYWQIAGKKSGNFFSLASFCGARLATNDQQKLTGFEEYGFHLGLLIQLLDDLEDIYLWMNQPDSQLNLSRCLPIVYSMDVGNETEKNLVKEFLDDVNNQEYRKGLIRLLDQNGAVLYLSSEIERHYGLALAGLENAEALPPAVDKLKEIIAKLTPLA